MRATERVFVDTGAWIALAVTRDSLHERAVATWHGLERAGARLFCSVPIVLETFTYLDRKGSRELALRWRSSIKGLRRFQILGCAPADLEAAFVLLDRGDVHKLSLVDATSFVLMRKHDLRMAFTFDTHFAVAGFRIAE